jgi:hypothetical protein
MRMAKVTWLFACAAAAAGVAAAAGGPQAFAAGDPAAKAEVIAAFQKLNALPSFRIKWTNPEGSGIAEFIQPDKRHFTGKSDKGSVEIYQIGTENRMHLEYPGAPSSWRCTNAETMTILRQIDTGRMQKDLTDVNRRPDTVIDGVPVHGYADSKDSIELYVGTQSGLPRRLVGKDNRGYTADFYDYGAPIPFTPPPCG